MILKKQWFYGIFSQKFTDSYVNITLLDETLQVNKTPMMQLSVTMISWVQLWADLII